VIELKVKDLLQVMFQKNKNLLIYKNLKRNRKRLSLKLNINNYFRNIGEVKINMHIKDTVNMKKNYNNLIKCKLN